jgi:hypothetical protein
MYHGAEPGGGGYVAQRIYYLQRMKTFILATSGSMLPLCGAAWPWILWPRSLVLYPDLADKEIGFYKGGH